MDQVFVDWIEVDYYHTYSDSGLRVVRVKVGDIYDELSDSLVGLLPEGYTANKVYVGDYTSEGSPQKDILKYIDNGSLLVNYTGHGAVERWGLWNDDKDTIFKCSDIDSLKSTNKLTVVTVANCLNGFFPGPKTQISVAEEFQRVQGRGAVAVWAPTALSYTSGHSILMKELYEAIFQDGQYGLGAVTTAAKIDTYAQSKFWSELVETFVLRYSVNNGRTWKKLAKKAEGSSFDWKVPVVKKSMKNCLIQVIGFDESGKRIGKDTSDSTFTIEASE